MEQHTDPETKAKILAMIKDIKVTLMATHDAAGKLHARPMVAVTPEEPFEGVLWFFTREGSRKTDELKADPRVLLSYAEPSDQNYVSIYGQGSVVRDAALVERMWSEFMRTWFPKGPTDPENRADPRRGRGGGILGHAVERAGLCLRLRQGAAHRRIAEAGRRRACGFRQGRRRRNEAGDCPF